MIAALSMFSLILGVAGMVFLSILVIPIQIQEAIDDRTRDRLTSILLPIAKVSYIVSFFPGLLFLCWYAWFHPATMSQSSWFRLSIGLGAFINCCCWILIYQKKLFLKFPFMTYHELAAKKG